VFITKPARSKAQKNIADAHSAFDTVFETGGVGLPLLHGMEERAGERRGFAVEPEDTGSL
jgi:hypothetical protein